jgi:alanine-glyoxylate transaminase/serine-glyoxylate transaminase/serine-pyruvate transaminase
VAWGAGAPVKEFERRLGADRNGEIKAVFVTHNETATGVTSDVAAVRRALDASFHDALLFVDGVSSIGSIEFRMDDWGVDLAVTGSQKGLMLPGGPRYPRGQRKGDGGLAQRDHAPGLFRIRRHGEDECRRLFPLHPAHADPARAAAALARIDAEGLDAVIARHYRLAEGVRRAVHAWGLDLVAEHRTLYSDTVSAIRVPQDSRCPRRAAHRL